MVYKYTVAPRKIKRLVRVIKKLQSKNMLDEEICRKLSIDSKVFARLQSLLDKHPLSIITMEPIKNTEKEMVSLINDILSSSNFTEEEKMFIKSQLNNVEIDRKRKYNMRKKIHTKLIRSGYGTQP